MIDPASFSEAKAKGTAFLGIFNYVKGQARGKELLEKVIASLAPEHARFFKRRMIAIVDYPYPAFIDLLRVVDRVLGKGDLSLCRELGKYTATLDIESVYYVYKKRVTPQDLSRDSNIIWKSYYTNSGIMKTEDITPDNTVIRIYDFPGMDPAHCRLMEGWMIQAIIAASGVWVQEMREVKCVSRGDEFHEFRGHWKVKEE